MGDENPIRTLGDYSKPSHEGYRNTIELPVGNNVDPNQHLKDFLKLVDSLDLDGSITTWEDLTTRFLAQFFLPERTAKLSNDILMFQQHHGESLSEAWTHFKDLLQKVPLYGIDLWLQDLALYDNESWNDPRDFAKPVKAIALPQDVPMNKITTSCEICSGPHDTQYCIEDPEQAFVEYASSRTDKAIEGLVSCFMASQDARLTKFEADFKQKQNEMTNKIDTVLKAIIDPMTGALPSDTVKNPKLSTYLVLSARSYPTEDPQCSTHVHGSINTVTICPKQPNEPQNDKPEEEEEKDNPENIHVNPPTPPDPSFHSSPKIWKNDDSCKEEPEAGEQEVEYFDVLLTRSELAYHKYLMCGPIPSIFLRNPIITEGYPSNLKIPCNIRHVHVERAYIDLNSSLSIMTRMLYNWILRRKLDPWENSNRGISNFTGRIKGMHVLVRNFTYITDFMIVEDISSIIDHRFSQVVLRRPFIKIFNMTHDPPEGVVRFTNGNDEVEYKMPHKIEQYNSLSNLEKEHTKSVYLINEEDKRRGVKYVMSKILGFYKECLELGPGYLTRMDDEGEIT
ncbi:MAK10-like protein [Tanacetum coccineum]